MGTMNMEYGKRVASALRAVRQLHSDTSKLLLDLDKKRFTDGWYSVFENNATRGLTYSVNADFWMAEAVYRFYARHDAPGLVEGLTVCFFRAGVEEPLLFIGQLEYQTDPSKLMKDLCQSWDIWDLYFEPPGESKALNKVHVSHKHWRGTMKWGKVLAAPLYSIRRVEDVEDLVNEVREAKV